MALKLDIKIFLREQVWDKLKETTPDKFIDKYPELIKEIINRKKELKQLPKLKKFLQNQKLTISNKEKINVICETKKIKIKKEKEKKVIIAKIEKNNNENLDNKINEYVNKDDKNIQLKEEIKQYYYNKKKIEYDIQKFTEEYINNQSNKYAEYMESKYNKDINYYIAKQYTKELIIYEIDNNELNEKSFNTILSAKQTKINQDNIFLSIIGNKHFYISQEISKIDKEMKDNQTLNENYKIQKILSLLNQSGQDDIKKLCENYMLENKILINIMSQPFYEAKNKFILQDLETKAKLQETQTNRIQQDITLKENENTKEVGEEFTMDSSEIKGSEIEIAESLENQAKQLRMIAIENHNN